MLVKFDTRRLDPNDFNDLTHASNEKTRDGRKVAWPSTKALSLILQTKMPAVTSARATPAPSPSAGISLLFLESLFNVPQFRRIKALRRKSIT